MISKLFFVPFLLIFFVFTNATTVTDRDATDLGIEGTGHEVTVTPRAPFKWDLSQIFKGVHDHLSALDVTAGDRTDADFWEMAKESEETLRDYARRLLETATTYFQSTAFTTIASTMNDIVVITASFRESVTVALEARDTPFSSFIQELEVVFMEIYNDLATVSPPDRVLGHAERAAMANNTLDDITRELTKLAARHGIEEDVVTIYLLHLRPNVLALIVAVGDINEQCPLLFSAVAFCIVSLLLPEIQILRPLLNLFGFGPAGPIKGSVAAWLQSYFWGAKVEAGSWFSWLQAAGMGALPKWAEFIEKMSIPIGGLVMGIISCFNHN